MTSSPVASQTRLENGADFPHDLLVAEGITKSYRRGTLRRRRHEVLKGASLSLGRGEIVGLVGENGSGKSTLMKILVGSLDRDSGQVSRTQSFGYCPQYPVLYERLTADEHFELFAVAYGLSKNAMAKSRDEVYDALDFEHYRSARVEELSGGTRAKLNLGLALLPDPELLLLDEPYAGFDWDTYLRFWALTAGRRDAGRSVLIVSHFVADEERFDRVVRLRNGVLSS